MHTGEWWPVWVLRGFHVLTREVGTWFDRGLGWLVDTLERAWETEPGNGLLRGTMFGLWIVIRRRRATAEDLGFRVEPNDAFFTLLGIALSFSLAVLLIPIAAAFGEENSGQQLVDIARSISDRTWLVAVAGLGTVILGPVMEELLFRGLLLRYLLQRVRDRSAILISSLVFGIAHVGGLVAGASLGQAVLVFLGPFLLGIPLAWMTIRQQRLGWAIFTHAGFNLLTMVVLIVPPELLEAAANGA